MPGTLKLKSEAGGSVILTANTTAASDLSLTIPPYAGTVATLVANTSAGAPYFSTQNVVGNGPIFSAYLSGNQTILTGTLTKVAFNVKEFDTNNFYDNVTNYRFQPSIAGYYNVCSHLFYNLGVSSIVTWNYIYKNGNSYKWTYAGGSNSGGYFASEVNAVVYMNGTTDYLEVYTQQNSGSNQSLGNGGGVGNTWFSAYLLRTA